MESIILFIKNYWTQIIFISGMLSAFFFFGRTMIDSTKCSLRNDILEIYDRCKDKKKITHYQLEAIQHSYDLYKKLKGNSFVEDVVRRVQAFELID